jgi:phosphate transport system ATP-binding protein
MIDVSTAERPPSDPIAANSPEDRALEQTPETPPVQRLPATASIKLATVGLSAGLGRSRTLFGIDLALERLKVTAIIGPAASGKTMLLRCLNRMHELLPGATWEGQVLLDDKNVYERGVNAASIRRRVAMIFQQPNPFVAMSVRENVLAGVTLNGIRVQDPNELVERLLVDVALWDELKDDLDRPALSLSEGQQQRLCVARCLALKPEVILMDEPCSELDAAEAAELESLIYRLKAEYTIVIATQNLQQAARVASKTAFLHKGQLVEYDKTAVIFTRPTQQRTEDYITGRFR